MKSNWRDLVRDTDLDLALLQEAVPPPDDIAVETVPPRNQKWFTAGYDRCHFCAAIARLSDRVQVRPLALKPLPDARRHELGVSLPGTLAACEVTDRSRERIVVCSMYGAWMSAFDPKKSAIFADASVHRIISDLSALTVNQRGHKIIAAGDLNIFYGYGDKGSKYWAARYETVFARMAAIGLTYVGPHRPMTDRGRRPYSYIPAASRNVPTFRTRKSNPETAIHQIDFVFASVDLAPRLRVEARDSLSDWGNSDHCRIDIDLRP